MHLDLLEYCTGANFHEQMSAQSKGKTPLLMKLQRPVRRPQLGCKQTLISYLCSNSLGKSGNALKNRGMWGEERKREQSVFSIITRSRACSMARLSSAAIRAFLLTAPVCSVVLCRGRETPHSWTRRQTRHYLREIRSMAPPAGTTVQTCMLWFSLMGAAVSPHSIS